MIDYDYLNEVPFGTIELDFAYGNEVSIGFGCGLTLNGQMWYFGGNDRRQVSSKLILQIQILHS